MRYLSLAAALLLLAACTSVPRQDAIALATAGQQATNASQQSLAELSQDIQNSAERQLVNQALINCKVSLQNVCDPAEVTPEVQNAIAANRGLAKVIALRIRAMNALYDAYGALKAEAQYDARGDLEGAVGKLFGSVNTLASSIHPAGGPVIAALSPLAQKAAGLGADAAQKKRLKTGSALLREADSKLAEAISAEIVIYETVAKTNVAEKKAVEESLIDFDLVDTTPLVADFSRKLGMSPAAKLGGSKYAKVAARTIFNYQSREELDAAGDIYGANVEALKALVEQHRKFEDDKPVSLEDVQHSINEMLEIASLLHDLDKLDNGTAPNPGESK